MSLITLLDIIKDSSTTKTIWIQELGRTKDYDMLNTLLSAYVDVAKENLHTERQVEYSSFYDAVLRRFEEMV